MNVSELMKALQQIQQTFPNAEVRVEAWNDSGDLQNVKLRGDVRLGRDHVGVPEVVIR
jgi:hypothetical protein